MPLVILFLATALMLISAAGCGGTDAVQLDDVEIRDYEGKDLSSVATDFRENSIKGPQFIDKEKYQLEVDGLVEKPGSFTYDEVIDRQLYRKVATLECVEGWSVDILWEGILLRDLLAQTVIKSEANTVILYAYDGYSTSFPLSFFYDRDIIMANRMNDVIIPPERGWPFMLVAEDKWGYKWIKWITRIELSDNEDYRGYWESRGYSQEAERGGDKFD